MANEEIKQCPICKLTNSNTYITKRNDFIEHFKCCVCGEFDISFQHRIFLESSEPMLNISAWIRDRYESGAEAPMIDIVALETIKKTIPDYRVSEKQLMLMRSIKRRTEYPGQSIEISTEFDYPLAWAQNRYEFIYLLEILKGRKLIFFSADLEKHPEVKKISTNIIFDGWDYLDKHARSSVISDQAFVAMDFHPSMRPVFDNPISNAILKAHFKPYRVDGEPHIERIDAKIITEIKNSKFLVADVTNQKQGVYFEAGYALGLGLPVIWCCREDDSKKIHFDTRQYNHIFWKDEDELEEQLYYFISAIIGKGSYKGG